MDADASNTEARNVHASPSCWRPRPRHQAQEDQGHHREQFKVDDQDTEPRAAHMMLEHAWVGTIEFQEIINVEGANIVASTRWADWPSDEEFEGFDAAASASPYIGKSEKGQSDTKASTRRDLLSLSARAPRRR